MVTKSSNILSEVWISSDHKTTIMHLSLLFFLALPLGAKKTFGLWSIIVSRTNNWKWLSQSAWASFRISEIYGSATGSLNKRVEKICLNWSAQQLLWWHIKLVNSGLDPKRVKDVRMVSSHFGALQIKLSVICSEEITLQRGWEFSQ